MKSLRLFAIAASFAFPAFAFAESGLERAPVADAQQAATWSSIINVHQLKAQMADPNVVVVDARKAEEYDKGHVPGAINLPGAKIRTPSAKPGQGDSQYFFRAADGSPDVARYEKLLSDAGLTRDQHVIVYGNHAGTADGSVAAMIFWWLGQAKVQFVDGIAIDQWTAAGYPLAAEATVRKPAQYVAQARDNFVWNLPDVLANLNSPDVVFYDTRSRKEFTGEDKRDNARGGHIPGAVWLDYADFLNKDKTSIALPEIRKKLFDAGITPDKKVVLYCQTATRVSLPLLALSDLGYKNVYVYDASWHEYGNRDDTPITTGDAMR
jgi:thiosulfate/3-mercaptopyruvate sulfurtransferase